MDADANHAASNLVIKVKYGDVLRRFNARVVGYELDIGLDGLKEKISSLFSLPPDSELVITYVDEDGDDVTLVDDSELRDVVKQDLNPLRITVQLKAEKYGTQERRLSGISIPLSASPRIRRDLEEFNAKLKIVRDVSDSNASDKDAGLGKTDNTTSKVLESEDKSTKGKESSKETQSEANMESGNVASPSKASCPKVVFSSVSSKTTSSASKKKPTKKANASSSGHKSQTTKSDSCGNTNLSTKQPVDKVDGLPKAPRFSPILPPSFAKVPRFPSPPLPASRIFPFVGSNPYDGGRIVTHNGVQCDVCGVHPITGPRFKSIVKEDYDLCRYCYNNVGNDKDYIKMDCPVMGAHHVLKPFQSGVYSAPATNIKHARVNGSVLKISNSSAGSKLSNRFILDVNVVDGTTVAPLTTFTKTWRMRNNGNVVWPKKTQLVWVGGDKLCSGISFELDIPEAGLAVDEELDVSVDFVSPECPGRYISYWKMASPSDQMFGQRVWVLIQVDDSLKGIENMVRSFNLNSLPTNNDANGHDTNMDDLEPIVDSLSHSVNSNNTVQSAQPATQPSVDHEKKFPINDSLLIGDGTLSSPNPNSVPYPNIGFSNVGSVLSSVPPPAVFVSRPDSVVFPKSPAQEIPKEVEGEEELLRQLQNMGFKKVDLNKETLRLNGYDMGKTVDDLCGAEWDPMLKELHEMGFTDDKRNKMLLEKNKGSIKRVVLDLI